MNVGPVNSTIANTENSAAATQAGEAAQINDSSSQTSERGGGGAILSEESQTTAAGAPKPLKQMATADFLSLHNTYQSDNVMDKLEKMFETIIALKILEDTIENIKKLSEENNEEGKA